MLQKNSALAFVLVCFFLLSACSSAKHTQARAEVLLNHNSPAEAMLILLEGNKRYIANEAMYPHQNASQRLKTSSQGQKPLALVLSCSDSRVPVEIIFDLGVGDIFVVRVAGNTTNSGVLGSIEYGVMQLDIPLILVLGHSQCGAVSSVIEGKKVTGNLAELLEPVIEAVDETRRSHKNMTADSFAQAAIENNVRKAMASIANSHPEIAQHIETGALLVKGGIYNLSSGEIILLD